MFMVILIIAAIALSLWMGPGVALLIAALLIAGGIALKSRQERDLED